MKISSLTFSKANCNGRNARGQIVIRFRRSINNRRAIFDRYRSLIKVKSYVIQRRLKEIRLMYHPFNVLSNILSFEQGFVGNKIQAYNKQVNIMWVGDSNCLGNFRIKDRIHCAGIKYGRASGCFLTIYRKIKIKKNLYVGLVLPSGVKRYLQSTARATLGILAGGFKRMQHIGSAGNNFSLGRRPRVRGVAMNPIDHPHGGGEGKTSGGRHPVSKWGKLTKGKKTVLKKRNAFGLET
jgi:large subunit ribosomal protein L2